MLITIALAALLGQAGSTGEAAPTDDAAPAPAPAAPSRADEPLRGPNPDQLQRQIEKMRAMNPEDAAKAAADLANRMPKVSPESFTKSPTLAGPTAVIPEVKDYSTLPETEQVKYSAREFFTQLIAGDARNITNNCGLPFQLEERRLQTPEELFQEWLRNLRAKRTDLLTLYDIEVLAPADMEKKYGKPPQRLSQLPWRGQKTYVAVANLSGHAAIAVFRQAGASWVVVGYAD